MNRLDVAPPLSDPSGQDTLANAALWVQHALLGTVATTVAVIAIAALGIMMLTGRLALRNGGITILGSFVLFGAPAIALGLLNLASRATDRSPSTPVDIARTPPPILTAPPAQYDPYAGASVPPR